MVKPLKNEAPPRQAGQPRSRISGRSARLEIARRARGSEHDGWALFDLDGQVGMYIPITSADHRPDDTPKDGEAAHRIRLTPVPNQLVPNQLNSNIEN